MNKFSITLYKFENTINDLNSVEESMIKTDIHKYSLNHIPTIIFLFSSNYPSIKH